MSVDLSSSCDAHAEGPLDFSELLSDLISDFFSQFFSE